MSREIDITNQRFGKVVAICKSDKKAKNRQVYWKCLCDCGLECYYISSVLRGPKMNSINCGCQKNNIKKLLTKEFLIEQYIQQQKSTRQIANEFNIKSTTAIKYYLKKFQIPIRKGSEAALLCQKNRKGIKDGYYEEIGGGYWYAIRKGAKNRGIEFNVTREYIWDVFIKQDRKCALTGRNIIFTGWGSSTRYKQTASLDRIDSDKGYIEGNLQWVHKDMQRIKMNMNDKAFYEICKLVYLNCKDKYE